MKKIVSKSVLLLILLLAACTKEIRYEGDEGEPMLVVNALMENDTTMAVYLERSLFFLDNDVSEDKQITSGASIKLVNETTGEIQIITVPSTENKYVFPVVATASHKYSIEVTHSGYPTATSSMTSAPKVVLSSVDTSSFETIDGESRKRAVLKWIDPPGKNYYFIHVLTYDQVQDSYYDTQIETDDVSFDNENAAFGDNYGYEYLNFTDEFFDSETKEFEIDFYNILGSQSNPISFRYELICLTEESYNYHVSVRKAANTDFLSEPVKIFNNIENGYGIFAGFNRSIIVK